MIYVTYRSSAATILAMKTVKQITEEQADEVLEIIGQMKFGASWTYTKKQIKEQSIVANKVIQAIETDAVVEQKGLDIKVGFTPITLDNQS